MSISSTGVVMSETINNSPKRNIPELLHRNFRDDKFWQNIPGWAGVQGRFW